MLTFWVFWYASSPPMRTLPRSHRRCYPLTHMPPGNRMDEGTVGSQPTASGFKPQSPGSACGRFDPWIKNCVHVNIETANAMWRSLLMNQQHLMDSYCFLILKVGLWRVERSNTADASCLRCSSAASSSLSLSFCTESVAVHGAAICKRLREHQ